MGAPARPDDGTMDYKDVAELSGLTVNYLRVMNHRGDMPECDGYRANRPYWKPAKIRAWLELRAKGA